MRDQIAFLRHAWNSFESLIKMLKCRIIQPIKQNSESNPKKRI